VAAHDAPPDDFGPVEVRRSARRRRTVTAYRAGDRTIVLLPARMSRADEAEWIRTMLDRLARKEARAARSAAGGDEALARRAAGLSERYLDGRAVPASVRWVGNQTSRWGSCTPSDRSIRLSNRIAGMPDWVVDYVLVHELAHLVEPGHSARFWKLVARYPLTERARGYLLGVAASHPELPEATDVDDVDDAGVHQAGVTELRPRTRRAGRPGDPGQLELS
jgi:predicted metal-dependent hydrolase